MKKTMRLILFTSIFLFLPLTVFSQNSVVPIDITVGGQHYTFNNSKDVTAQIELREAKIGGNSSEIKYINSMKIRVIERDNLSLWKRTFDVDIREYNRQIKELEDENKRYKKEISQLNRVLRRFK